MAVACFGDRVLQFAELGALDYGPSACRISLPNNWSGHHENSVCCSAGGAHRCWAAYVIAESEITDPEAFKEFAPKVPPTVQAFGGRYLSRGGKAMSFDGEPPKRVNILVFESMDKAQAWLSSPEYKAIVPLRDKVLKIRLYAVEGASN